MIKLDFFRPQEFGYYSNILALKMLKFLMVVLTYGLKIDINLKVVKLKLNIQDASYIFIDESSSRNIKFMIDNVNIYILKDYESLCYFHSYDFYFLRGCYFNYYNQLVNTKKTSIVVYYSAVSLQYNFYYNNKQIKSNEPFLLSKVDKELKFNTEHDFLTKIDVSLIHENENYNYIFKYSANIPFFKFGSNHFKYLDLERTIDYIFIADSTQYTKNHDIMFNFINYCEKNKTKVVIKYISNYQDLLNKFKLFVKPESLNYVELEYLCNLAPKELNVLLNKTKINLLFSNRDACPRVLCESLYAGCYNVVLDLLSDGKNYFDNLIFGKILNFNNLYVKISKSNSLIYLDNNIIHQNILQFKDISYNHKMISEKAINMFNLESTINSIYNVLKNYQLFMIL